MLFKFTFIKHYNFDIKAVYFNHFSFQCFILLDKFVTHNIDLKKIIYLSVISMKIIIASMWIIFVLIKLYTIHIPF